MYDYTDYTLPEHRLYHLSRDGSFFLYDEMDHHHAWNTLRLLKRTGHDIIPYALLDNVGNVSTTQAAWYHVRNVLWLLSHPHRITWCMVRGI